jgi:tetratricopeptide (TPR) repeat protein
MKGEPKNALIYLNKSLVLREKNNDQEGIATVLNNIGETYNNIGQIAKSIDYYSKSLKIYEKIEMAKAYKKFWALNAAEKKCKEILIDSQKTNLIKES